MGKAHRWMATQQYGEIPAGMVVDHRCRNKSCVCPRHLEVVSVAENNRRIYADKTLCNYGHPLDGVGVKYKRRWCNTCNRERQRRRRATKGGQ